VTEYPTTHGYVWNCYVKSRDGDTGLFFVHDDTVTARLDGYAIVPREEYDALEAERDAALARIARLEAALRPFVEERRRHTRHLIHRDAAIAVRFGDLQAAADALADAPVNLGAEPKPEARER
jgi:hypothetical protein